MRQKQKDHKIPYSNKTSFNPGTLLNLWDYSNRPPWCDPTKSHVAIVLCVYCRESYGTVSRRDEAKQKLFLMDILMDGKVITFVKIPKRRFWGQCVVQGEDRIIEYAAAASVPEGFVATFTPVNQQHSQRQIKKRRAGSPTRRLDVKR